jgi:hypothetical protein
VFRPDPYKHWSIWPFIGLLCMVVFTFSHHIIIAIVLYAVVKAFTSTHTATAERAAVDAGEGAANYPAYGIEIGPGGTR